MKHGIHRYGSGCRCEICREAKRVATARSVSPMVPPGHLAITCWCEDQIVTVTERDVFEGRTLSCGLGHCKPST